MSDHGLNKCVLICADETLMNHTNHTNYMYMYKQQQSRAITVLETLVPRSFTSVYTNAKRVAEKYKSFIQHASFPLNPLTPTTLP